MLLNSVMRTFGCTLSTLLRFNHTAKIEENDYLVTVIEDPRGKGAFQVGRTHEIRGQRNDFQDFGYVHPVVAR